MNYTYARKELGNLISHNKDDLGRTIISGLITDFLDWHKKEVKKLNLHIVMQAEGSDVSEGAAVGNSAAGQSGRDGFWCASDIEGKGRCEAKCKWCIA